MRSDLPAPSGRPPGRWIAGWERRSQPLLPLPEFLQRVFYSLLLAGVFIAFSLLVGMAGYAGFEGMGLTDSFLNASMILSGMGPAAELHTAGGKWFAGAYALYSGLTVLAVAGLVLAPIAHRLLHHFHADETDFNPDEDKEPRAQ